MPPPLIDQHPSAGEKALRLAVARGLLVRQIDPKFLYATPRQAELWRQVFLRHSPVHRNPEFVRIYREAFIQVLERLTAPKILLVGLGCGTGTKELALYASLREKGREAVFTAIDVSYDLVVESVDKLVAAGAGHERSLVCDLAQAEDIGKWLDGQPKELPRLITFFGLVPNLAPSVVTALFRAVLRPGDRLLASAHLAPVFEGMSDLTAAMQTVLPQYNNPETLAWLAAALEQAGLTDRLGMPDMTIGEVEGIPAFLGQACWQTEESFTCEGFRIMPRLGESLRLFHSLRYTPALFEARLTREGFQAERLALTSCREEAIWCIRHG